MSSVASLNLEKFDMVWFTPDTAKYLEQMGLPYPKDWHYFMEVTEDKMARFQGSMGGRFFFPVDAPVIARHSK